jgi:hypothetical protein
MANVNLPSLNFPLSGAVAQTLFPWSNYFTVNVGTSSNEDAEKTIIADVAGYGQQLGRLGDALIALLNHLQPDMDLTALEHRAIDQLKAMLNEIADVKEQHGARHVLRPNW